MSERLPVLAVVGRPNVGKSTLVNRILGRREAVVEDVPGRDPRPGHLRRHVERPGASPSSTPAAGTPTPAGWPSGSGSRPRWRSRPRTR